MYKIGACAGKFRIIHQGHLEYFIQASLLCDEVHVFFVSDNSVNRYLSEQKTIQVIDQIFSSLNVKYHIHQTEFKSGEVWDQYLIDTIGTSNFTIFNSKEDYENILVENQYLNCLSDETISATEIEKNIYEYENFNNIETTFASYLTKTILIKNCSRFPELNEALTKTYKNNRFEFVDKGLTDFVVELKADELHEQYIECLTKINQQFNIRR